MKIRYIILLLLMIVGLGNLHSQSTDRNYVYQRTFQDENGTKSLDVIHYFDGLGRSVQTVQRGITPTGSDLVDYMEYDLYGRESNRWLPVAIPGNGGAYADLNKVKANTDMLYPADLYPYAKSEYEASPLNRVLKQVKQRTQHYRFQLRNKFDIRNTIYRRLQRISNRKHYCFIRRFRRVSLFVFLLR